MLGAPAEVSARLAAPPKGKKTFPTAGVPSARSNRKFAATQVEVPLASSE